MKKLLFAAALLCGTALSAVTAPTAQAITLHDQLVQTTNVIVTLLPRKINNTITEVDARMDGLQVTQTYTVTSQDLELSLPSEIQWTCSNQQIHPFIVQGASFRYIYWYKGQLRRDFTVSAASCGTSVQVPAAPTVASSMPIVVYHNSAYVTLTIGTQLTAAAIDTGCEGMTVNATLATQLLNSGEATKLGNSPGVLADGSQKTTPMINIGTVTIGGHVLTDIHARVMPDGATQLLGFAVLNRISGKFAINTTASTLDFE